MPVPVRVEVPGIQSPQEHYCGYYCNNRKHGLGVVTSNGDYYETQHVAGRLVAAEGARMALFANQSKNIIFNIFFSWQ